MYLPTLPTELILLAAHFLPLRDIYSLILTSRRLCIILTPHLHTLALENVVVHTTTGRSGSYTLTALQWAASRGYYYLATILVSKGVDVNYTIPLQRAGPPLHHAIIAHSPAIVKLLLDNGARMDAVYGYSGTAIHKTVDCLRPGVQKSRGSTGEAPELLEIMALLLDKGPDLDHQMLGGGTALHDAMAIKDPGAVTVSIIELLLEAGAAMNLRDYGGRAPIHYSVSCEFEEGIRLLIKYGANLEITDRRGFTPTAIAAHYTLTGAIRALMEGGADLEMARIRHEAICHSSDSPRPAGYLEFERVLKFEMERKRQREDTSRDDIRGEKT